MILRAPGLSGRRDELVEHLDVGPTLLDLCGLTPLGHADSISFAPVLWNPQATVRDTFFAESYGTRFSLTQRILWQGDWKFAFNGFDFDELYNLAEDPGETTNLVNDPQQQQRVRAMMSEVWNWLRKTNDRTLLETHYFSMRMGRVGPELSS